MYFYYEDNVALYYAANLQLVSDVVQPQSKLITETEHHKRKKVLFNA